MPESLISRGLDDFRSQHCATNFTTQRTDGCKSKVRVSLPTDPLAEETANWERTAREKTKERERQKERTFYDSFWEI